MRSRSKYHDDQSANLSERSTVSVNENELVRSSRRSQLTRAKHRRELILYSEQSEEFELKFELPAAKVHISSSFGRRASVHG